MGGNHKKKKIETHKIEAWMFEEYSHADFAQTVFRSSEPFVEIDPENSAGSKNGSLLSTEYAMPIYV